MSDKVTFVHGSYFNKNYGDYLLIKIAVESIREGSVKLPFASKSVLTEFNGNLRKTVLSDFLNAERCIFGGGGYFGEPPQGITKWSINFIRRHFIPFLIMRLFSIKVDIVGAGFGPISSPFLKPFVRFMLKHSNKVCFRDIESVEYARNILPGRKYELVTDLAQDGDFLKRVAIESNLKLEQDKYIAIHVGSVVSEDLERQIQEKIKKLKSYGFDVIFFSDSPGHNSALKKLDFTYGSLVESLNLNPEKCKFAYTNAEDVTNIIANSSGVITGKLHVGIVATTLGLPVLSTPLHHKTIRYYKDIDNLECCIEEGKESPDSIIYKINNFEKKVLNSSRHVLNERVLSRHKKAMKLISGTVE